MLEDNKVNETLESMKAEIDGITNQLKQFDQQANLATSTEGLQQLEEKMNRELSSLQDQMDSKWPIVDKIPKLVEKLQHTNTKLHNLATHRVPDLVNEIKIADGLVQMQITEQL